MIFNRYVGFLLIAAVLSVLALLLVSSHLDPYLDEPQAQILFFVSLFFAISSSAALLWYFIRVFFFPHEMMNHFNISLRQGILASLLFCCLLGFQAIRTLNIWTAMILVTVTFLLELHSIRK